MIEKVDLLICTMGIMFLVLACTIIIISRIEKLLEKDKK